MRGHATRRLTRGLVPDQGRCGVLHRESVCQVCDRLLTGEDVGHLRVGRVEDVVRAQHCAADLSRETGLRKYSLNKLRLLPIARRLGYRNSDYMEPLFNLKHVKFGQSSLIRTRTTLGMFLADPASYPTGFRFRGW